MEHLRVPMGVVGAFFTVWMLFALTGDARPDEGPVSKPVKTARPKSGDEIDFSPYYGFKPVEAIKLEPRASNLLAGDFNGDGLGDLVLFDNGHARIDLLLQRRRPSEPSPDSAPTGVNEIAGDGRFEHKKIPLDKQLASMAVGDFNGDGRTDIACFGVPDRLMIFYQPAKGEWRERTTMRVPDVAPVQWNMAAGDLNGDGKDDLAILGKHQSYIFLQQAKGGLAPPIVLMNTSEKLSLAQVVDLNGDGRKDLCYLAGETQERVLCARLQDASGRLGPELQFEVDPPRSVSYADIAGRRGREILTIDNQTGRLKILQMQTPSGGDDEPAGRLVQTGFGRQESSERGRDFALGDIDGDGHADLVVTDPDGAGVFVFRQRKGEGLDPGQTFPSFAGVAQVRVADLDGDKKNEVVVLSTKERAIGISRFQHGRLTFPETVPLAEEEPILLEIADLNGDKNPEILFISRVRSGGNTQYVLHALERTAGKKWRPFAFSGKRTDLPLDVQGTPTQLLRLDTNREGRPNFLLFQEESDRGPLLLATGADGKIAPVTAEDGLRLGTARSGAVFLTQDSVPSLLVAQENFARKLQRTGDSGWRVIDQYNASEPSAKIVGAAMLDLDGKPGREIVLIDTGIRKIRVLRKEGEVFRPWKEIELGSFPYEGLRVADLNGDGREDLLLIGRGRFAVLYAGKTLPTLNELGTFETKLTKTYFSDVVAGDLNGDGRTDLALIDTQSHFIEILRLDADHRPHHALSFKVFEEKSFAEGREGGTEPREGVITDVTGDGKPDLVLLAHDRVLIYPQDDGK
ncbi:MAG TPA: VCBS repeat-containing protein [Planctomycetaceae bacterium]|nr:VCBS repeat-containing protein [Planctomycetaceae bacterium]